jgi:hypothetical protein
MAPEHTSLKSGFFYFILLVLVVLLVFVTGLPHIFSESLWPDEALYGWLARGFWSNFSWVFPKSYIEFHPPLWAMFLSFAQYIPIDIDAALRSFSFVTGLSGIILAFYIGRRVVGSDFVGAICAVGVGLSPAYFLCLPRILADSAQMVVFMALVLALVNAGHRSSVLADILVGLAGGCLIGLKWSGVLAVPLVVIYYLFVLSGKERHRVLIPLFFMGGAIVFWLTNYFIRTGGLFLNISALQGSVFRGPPWFYLRNFNFIVPIFGGLPLLFFGCWVLWKEKHAQRLLVLVWFLICFCSVSLAGEKDFRYAFLFLPPALVLVGVAIEYLIRKFFKKDQMFDLVKKTACCLFLLAAFTQILRYGDKFRHLDNGYVGFKESGEVIKAYAGSATLIFAGSERAVRYYSGIEYKEYGGKIAALPRSFERLQQAAERVPGSTLLVIDAWEYTQPAWAFPFNAEKAKTIERGGFHLLSVIHRPVASISDPRELMKGQRPVVWIFQKGCCLGRAFNGRKIQSNRLY